MEELEASSFDDVMSPGFEAAIKVTTLTSSSSGQHLSPLDLWEAVFVHLHGQIQYVTAYIGRVMAHQVWLTFGFGLENLEKRLHAVTFNPAVFSADILASMFDTWKKPWGAIGSESCASSAVQCSTRRTVCYLQLGLLDLSSGSGHLVLQEGQLSVCGAAADTASTLLQVSQGPFQPIHGPRSQVHLHKWVVLTRACQHVWRWKATRCPLKRTFSSILVNFWSSLRVSELPETEEGLMGSDGVQLSPPASLISSSVALRTFSTSVVMLQSEAAVYFCFRKTTSTQTGLSNQSHAYMEEVAECFVPS